MHGKFASSPLPSLMKTSLESLEARTLAVPLQIYCLNVEVSLRVSLLATAAPGKRSTTGAIIKALLFFLIYGNYPPRLIYQSSRPHTFKCGSVTITVCKYSQLFVFARSLMKSQFNLLAKNDETFAYITF